MPTVEIMIGGRSFEVACQDGEEGYLQSAARILDAEAAALSNQAGRMTEAQLLLMSGLMLADKTAALEERLRTAERLAADFKQKITMMEARPAPAPQRIEVPVVPEGVGETMRALAARAEALAADVEDKAKSAD